MPTGKQIKAARAVLNWSVRDLASRTQIGSATLTRYEAVSGFPISRKGYLEKIRATFEMRGVLFVETADGYFGIVFKGAPKDCQVGSATTKVVQDALIVPAQRDSRLLKTER